MYLVSGDSMKFYCHSDTTVYLVSDDMKFYCHSDTTVYLVSDDMKFTAIVIPLCILCLMT